MPLLKSYSSVGVSQIVDADQTGHLKTLVNCFSVNVTGSKIGSTITGKSDCFDRVSSCRIDIATLLLSHSFATTR